MTLSFSPGALVAARGREWVVIEALADGALSVRPLVGLDHDTQVLFPDLENDLKSARFSPPEAGRSGPSVEARLLSVRPKTS
jgi:hypothetical protein